MLTITRIIQLSRMMNCINQLDICRIHAIYSSHIENKVMGHIDEVKGELKNVHNISL